MSKAARGYNEKLNSSRQSRPPSRVGCRRQLNSKTSSVNSERPGNESLGCYRHSFIKQDGRKGKYTSTRSHSVPTRPQTRRKLADMPNPYQYTSRTQSTGPPSDRVHHIQKIKSAGSPNKSPPSHPCFVDSPKQPLHVFMVNPEQISPPTTFDRNQPVPAPRKHSKKRDTSYKKSIAEHEYLQFSLRITEDIIRNDLYKNEEMRRVFNSHVEANRGRLDMAKMTDQVQKLCKELNIPFEDAQNGETATRDQIKIARQNAKTALTCICCPVLRPHGSEMQKCECESVRCLPLECIQHGSKVVGGGANKSNGINDSTKEKSVKDPSSENVSGSDGIDDEEFLETHYTENPETYLQAAADFFSHEDQNSNLSDITTPYVQISNLSCISEITEPTTSSETLNTKPTNSLPNTISEHDVLPCILPFNFSNSDIKNSISFEMQAKTLPSSSSQQNSEASNKASSVPSPSTEHQNNNVDQQTSSENLYWLTCSCHVPQESPLLGPQESVQYCELCIQSVELQCGVDLALPKENEEAPQQLTLSEDASKNYDTLSLTQERKPLPSVVISDYSESKVSAQKQSETEIIQSAPPITQLDTSNKQEIQSVISETNNPSASITKQKIEYQSSVESQPPTSNLIPNNCCDELNNSEYQVIEIVEKSNIKVRGANNKKEEFVLPPGCIYIPKAKRLKKNYASTSSSKEFVKDDKLFFSKDVIVNTDESYFFRPNELDNNESTQMTPTDHRNKTYNINKCKNESETRSISFRGLGEHSSKMSSTSDTNTYSNLHQSNLRTIHYGSFASNISSVSNIPQTVPITESIFYKQNLSTPPRVMLKRTNIAHTTEKRNSIVSSVSGYENSPQPEQSRYVIEQLNDYDLTPQRDNDNSKSNHSKTSSLFYDTQQMLSQMQINQGSLLLGDEYEIRESCYDNGLPYAICKFFPNAATQTLSSDLLLPSSPPKEKTKQKSNSAEWYWAPKESKDLNMDNFVSAALKTSEEFRRSFEIFDKQKSGMNLKYQKLQSTNEEQPVLTSPVTSENKSVNAKTVQILEKIVEDEFDDNMQKDETEDEFDNDEEIITNDIFRDLDREPSYVHYPSMMLTIEQVTDDLKKFRQTGPLDVYAQQSKQELHESKQQSQQQLQQQQPPTPQLRPRSLSPTPQLRPRALSPTPQPRPRALSPSPPPPPPSPILQSSKQQKPEEQPIELQTKGDSPLKNGATSTRKREHFSLGEGKLPYIEVMPEPEVQTPLKEHASNHKANTSCCGLKNCRKKKRRDILETTSGQTLPNVSAIPDDQLFVIDVRRPTVNTGYGADRKSLRFDYSAMKDFNKKVDASVNDILNYHDNPYVNSTTDLSPTGSDEDVPIVRKQIISYKQNQPPSPGSDHLKINDKQQKQDSGTNSIVDILSLQNTPSMQSFRIEAQDYSRKNSEASSNTK